MKSLMKKTLLSTTFLICINACTKDSQETDTGIPIVPVSLNININDPLYSQVKNVGGWTYVNGGSRGIILYQESVGVFKAYERQCTYDPSQVCSTLDMDPNLLQANDFDCCGSIFNILNGSIIQGPAFRSLVQYSTNFDGTFVTITN